MLTEARTAARERRAIAVMGSEVRPSAAVMLALAPIEARKILLHPVSSGTIAVVGLFLVRGVVGSGGSQNNVVLLIAGLAVGLIAGGFLSANVATQRAGRDHVLELFAALPSPPEARTGAVLLGALCGPVALSLLVAAVGWGILEANPEFAPDVDLALMVQLPLTVAALGALGVALGRWIPSLVAAPVVLIAQVVTGFTVWVLPWVAPSSSEIRMGWHLAYLLSTVVLWCGVAVLRDRRTPTRIALTCFAFGVVVAAVAVQVPPGGLASG